MNGRQNAVPEAGPCAAPRRDGYEPRARPALGRLATDPSAEPAQIAAAKRSASPTCRPDEIMTKPSLDATIMANGHRPRTLLQPPLRRFAVDRLT